MAREEKKVEGCLLAPANTKLVSSEGPVLLCGGKDCPARSDTIGDLGKVCTQPRR